VLLFSRILEYSRAYRSLLFSVVVVLGLNWDFKMLRDVLLLLFMQNNNNNYSLQDAWTGNYEFQIFNLALFYFVVDMAWVSIVPRCVRSLKTIILHHLACMVYLYLVYLHPEQFWFMGACLSIEINTWFLIARRVVNKPGFPVWNIDLPWGLSFRVKLISICFYITWFIGRCFLFPYLLTVVVKEWIVTRHFNLLVKLCMHSLFTYLNLKWSYDLIMSKINYIKKCRRNSRIGSTDNAEDKGL